MMALLVALLCGLLRAVMPPKTVEKEEDNGDDVNPMTSHHNLPFGGELVFRFWGGFSRPGTFNRRLLVVLSSLVLPLLALGLIVETR